MIPPNPLNTAAQTALALGATLYLPATRPDLVALGNGDTLPELRSLVYCTEDAVAVADVEHAIANLAAALPQLVPVRGRFRFVRPRSPALLARLLSLPGSDAIDGFVLPKASPANLAAYWELLEPHERFWLLPTLETRDVFDPFGLAALRQALTEPNLARRVLCLRIGGNDLLNLLGVRRRPGQTLYDTPLRGTLEQLVSTFKPDGFALSAPVYDDFGDTTTLAAEVARDLDFGLTGKTAIHPRQLAVIEAGYRVDRAELALADAILAADAPAVFGVRTTAAETMAEPSTQWRWATAVRARARFYGLRDAEPTQNPLVMFEAG
ncbi:MAG: HpcH/HpaI aldolase/citrate lyase family protein [Trueperaceae bacterium]|nr:HpcH/HpaI aldolase/citrate lyase family protein [Trueperaceae bacterium]